jgi:TonB family protein
MKNGKLVFITLIICLFAAFAVAQKTVRNKNAVNIKVLNSPLKIISRPNAPYPTDEGGSVCINGIVRLKVTFLETGQIGAIRIISSLPYGATENAAEAARKIEFQPAMKDGKPITVSKVVEYRFSENSINR